jgi:predicted N-acyltransferase
VNHSEHSGDAQVLSKIEVVRTLDQVERSDWNALVDEDDPFSEWEFLAALEDSGTVGSSTAWQPRYVLLRENGALVGACAMYVKYDSYGEFIFDWQWAEAYANAGISYYPKAVVAIPFTPVAGDRLLTGSGPDSRSRALVLANALTDVVVSEGLSGLHVLFANRDEHDLLTSGAQQDLLSNGAMMSRLSHQYHWENRGYAKFDDYLSDLRSKKRKQVNKERACVAATGLDVRIVAGDDIRVEHMDAIWRFYQHTQVRKWGQGYLNRETFERLWQDFRHRLVLVLAFDGSEAIAGTLNVRKGRRLLGRYWGCIKDVESLHFECCFYKLIEYAIAEGLELFEAGAQGEHKFLRGFAARPTYSAHWLAHEGGRRAIADYLAREREHIGDLIQHYNASSPLKPVRAAAAEKT